VTIILKKRLLNVGGYQRVLILETKILNSFLLLFEIFLKQGVAETFQFLHLVLADIIHLLAG
jgi:hypothetical protein